MNSWSAAHGALGKDAFLDTRDLTHSGETLETAVADGQSKAAIGDQKIGNGRKPVLPGTTVRGKETALQLLADLRASSAGVAVIAYR